MYSLLNNNKRAFKACAHYKSASSRLSDRKSKKIPAEFATILKYNSNVELR